MDPGVSLKFRPISPMIAVEYAWAIAAKFSKRPETKAQGQEAETAYTTELDKFNTLPNYISDDEKIAHQKYYSSLIATMDRTLRNLETYLVYRDDRVTEIVNIKQEKEDSMNQIKSLTMNFQTAFPKIASSTAIGGVSGLSLTNLLNQFQLNDLQKDILILTFLGIGYLVTDFVIVPLKIRNDKRAINEANKHSKEEYDLYLGRCRSELERLFITLKAAYKEAYRIEYPKQIIDGKVWSPEDVLPVNVEHLVKL